MKKLMNVFVAFALVLGFSLTVVVRQSEAKDSFRIAWSHYTGWEPWDYADKSGILGKWCSKYGITCRLDLVNDYVESINLYTAGTYDGCVMTNMDALTIPAVGGVDSTALIVGDFSNGNDGIVLRNGNSVKALKGRKVKLVELSVSHYLLARALDMNGLKERDLTVVNTSDADIAALFLSDKSSNGQAVVTWNPPLMQVRQDPKAKMVFDSSQIPGEIIDMMVVKTNSDERFKKALVGAWYEVMNVMSRRGRKANEALSHMAKTAGGTLAEFKSQLRTTAMFYKPGDAVSFTTSPKLKETMEYVRTFSFDHGLYGEGAADKNFVGIEFPDGSVLGTKKNIKLRFTDRYMKLAAENRL